MRFCLFFLFLVAITQSFGQNRIATIADRQVYGDYITPGDLIIDTPTRNEGSRRDVVYYFMAKQWPMLREGGTIWFDGDKLGPLTEIKFCNTSKSQMPWHIDGATFRNIPDTRVVTQAFACWGLRYFALDGESSSFPGLTAWPAARKFLTGAFGFHVIGNMSGGHCYNITVRDGGTIRMNGFEAQHAFSGVRLNGGKDDITVESIEISNFYIHDTATGEGQYLGSTQKGPYSKLKNLKVHHGVLARTAAEALQFQHVSGGADIHHITIFAADVGWMHAFMAGQDTGIQWVVDEGENRLHHIILDGFGSIGLMAFGSGQQGKVGISRVSNVLFNDGRDTGIYLHKATSFGVQWHFDSIYFRNMNENYYAETGRRERNFYVSRKHGTDAFAFRNVYHDGSKTNVFEDQGGILVARVAPRDLPAPAYINSGFYEPAHRIKQWHPAYAPYFPACRRDSMKVHVPTQWRTGDIAIETEGEYAFYKCIRTHTADERRPGDHPFFERLTWDSNGVRSDQPSWNANMKQSTFPPDDLRLKKDNYWKQLGLGFQEELLILTQQY